MTALRILANFRRPALVWAFLFFALPTICWPGFAEGFYEIKRITCLLVIGFATLLGASGSVLPMRLVRPLIALFGAKFLSTMLFHPGSLSVVNIAIDLVFPLAFILFYSTFRSTRDTQTFRNLAVVSALYLSIATLLNHELWPQLEGWTFGNPNMLAEFLVLLLPFSFDRLYETPIAKRRLAIGFTSTLFIFIALALLQSRSAWIAAALAILAQFAVLAFSRWGLKRALGASFAAVAVAGSIAFVVFEHSSHLRSEKRGSDRYRAQLYSDTWDLIQNTPSGVGLGQFEYSLIPFKHITERPESGVKLSLVDRNPHSEPLKWLAEDGWFAAAVALASAIAIFLTVFRKRKPWRETQRIALASSFGAVLIVQCAIQFPFENPASALLIAAVFALFCAMSDLEDRPLSRRVTAPLALLTLAAGLLLSFSQAIYSYELDDQSLLETACRIEPTQWRNCLSAIDHHVAKQEWPEARAFALIELKRRPLDLHALRALIQADLNEGLSVSGCGLASSYEALVPNEPLAQEMKRLCLAQNPSRTDFNEHFQLESYRAALEQE